MSATWSVGIVAELTPRVWLAQRMSTACKKAFSLYETRNALYEVRVDEYETPGVGHGSRGDWAESLSDWHESRDGLGVSERAQVKRGGIWP